jgi:hypothetical protein
MVDDAHAVRNRVNSGTQQRDRVAAIAEAKPQQALELAHGIGDPWFRCQALSIAAVHAPDRRTQRRAIEDALAAANELTEPNRVVTVCAWPVKALALTGNMPRVSVEVRRLLHIIAAEGSPVRRADALRYLFGAVSTATRDVARSVAIAFSDACLAPLQNGRRNRKGDSHLEECLPAIARIDPELARRLLRKLTPSRAERAAGAIESLKEVSVGEILPWPYFGAH